MLVNPEADLPEQRSLVLLIMPPDCAYSEDNGQQRLVASDVEHQLLELSQKCGSRDRHYRNTLLFLLPSPRGLTRLRSALREVAALEAVHRDYGSQLDSEQRDELKSRLDGARKNVTGSLGSAYTHVARIEGQSVAVSALTDPKARFDEHLREVWRQVVEDEEWVLRRVGMVTLQQVGLVPTEGGIRVKEAIEAFLRYTDKPMIASREALLEGLKQACKDKLVGIARGVNLISLQKKWCGEDVTLDPNEEGLWIIPPYEPESVPAGAGVTMPPPTPPPTDIPTGRPTPGMPTAAGGAGSTPAKRIKHIKISGAVSLDNWAEIFRCFISPAARMNLKRLRLGIDFGLEVPDDQSLDENDSTFKAMRESATQLGLKLETD